MDPTDGALYTEAEFVAHYGRIDEWVAAGTGAPTSASRYGSAEPATPFAHADEWETLDVAGIRRELKSTAQNRSTPVVDAEVRGDGIPAVSTGTAAKLQQGVDGCSTYHSGPSGVDPDNGGESDGEWVAEETLVLDDSWAEHFLSRAKHRVANSLPTTTKEASSPNSGTSSGSSNTSKISSGETTSRRRKRGAKKSCGGGDNSSNNIPPRVPASPATVARWKGVRYVTEDLPRVRAAEAAVRKVAQQYGKGRWPLYPDMPITAPGLG